MNEPMAMKLIQEAVAKCNVIISCDYIFPHNMKILKPLSYASVRVTFQRGAQLFVAHLKARRRRRRRPPRRK